MQPDPSERIFGNDAQHRRIAKRVLECSGDSRLYPHQGRDLTYPDISTKFVCHEKRDDYSR